MQLFKNKNFHRKSQNPCLALLIGDFRRVKYTLRPILIPTKYTKNFIKIGRAVSAEFNHIHCG